MKRYLLLFSALLLPACSGDDSGNGAKSDAATGDAAMPPGPEAGGQPEAAPSNEAAAPDTGGSDTGGNPGDGAANAADGSLDAGTDAPADAPAEASDASCPPSWFVAPTVDPSIAADGGVIWHAAANGTQNYTCKQSTADSGPPYTWTFVGPAATLTDCRSTVVGHHEASDGGPGFPEWVQSSDGTYVVGQRVMGFTPDGGSGSVPWLLLHAVGHGGTGTLSQAQYIERVNTDGGVAPAAGTCDQTSAGMTQQVPYTADYYFFNP